MKLIIGHLYYDLMNLYGDSGNIKVLEYHLKEQKIDYEVKKLSIDDKISFKDLDLIYIGSGTENNRNIVLKDLLKYEEDIKKYYQNNKFFLITGNAIQLFGTYILDNKKIVHKGLNLFSYYTKEEKRIVKEVSTNAKFFNDKILGFVNYQGNLYNKNNKIIDNYGIYKKNFYGTILLGPVLARNPEFLNYFLTNLIQSKNKRFKVKKINTVFDEEAYLDYIAFKNNI